MSEYRHVMEELDVDRETAERIAEVAECHYDGDIHSAEFALRESKDNGIDVDHYVEVQGFAADFGCDASDLLRFAEWAKTQDIFA